MDDDPLQIDLLRRVLLFLLVAAFVLVHLYFFKEILEADDKKPPDLDDLLVGVSTALAGALGAGFALAMGLKKAEELREGRSFTVGRTMLPKIRVPGLPDILRYGIWAYAGVGVLALLTFFTNQDETPEVVKGLAVGFAGYLSALVTNAFGTIKAS